ncbi:MAG: amino acid ABC transporter permease [Desulforudis sp.]|jgi:polar amino acid transport system permease protein|nr:MAG: amino acid ABC transporter permease [Desulforudis sp.]
MGAAVTLQITVISVSIGCVVGLFAGLARLSKSRIVRTVGTCYVDFFRGTPLYVQLLLVYFGFPQLINEVQHWLIASYGMPQLVHNFVFNEWTAAIITCSLNSGAYIAEIFRAGVQSIERGQMEAARSLGMSHVLAMRYVILPQAFKRVIPPLGNEFIAMLKDTSILAAIGFVELNRRGQLIVAEIYDPFPIFFTVALMYLAMTLTFSRLVDWLERRLKTDDRG